MSGLDPVTVPPPDALGLDALYQRFAEAQEIPGLIAGVVQAGRLVHLTWTGTANLASGQAVTSTTRFRIASMTKSVTALGILMLRDAGRLRLDDPVGEHLPAFGALPRPTTDSPAVTLRDLLTHVGGLPDDDAWGDRQLGMTPAEFDALIDGGGLFARVPRLDHEYSNLGYALLGRVIAGAVGQPYQAWLRGALLAPLGMTATSFAVEQPASPATAIGYRRSDAGWSPESAEPDGEFAAMGGLVTHALDYARYLAFLLDAWPARDGSDEGPVQRSTVRELALTHAMPTSAELRIANGQSAAVASAYGFGLISSFDAVLGRYLHHAGGLPGFGAHMMFAPECGIGLFSFANLTYAPVWEANLAAALELREAGLWSPRPVAPSAGLVAALAAVVRAYEAGRVAAAAPHLADNLLLDRPAEERDAELVALRRRLGAVREPRLEPRHALSGRFAIACAAGTLSGSLTLAPGPHARIQELVFETGAESDVSGRNTSG